MSKKQGFPPRKTYTPFELNPQYDIFVLDTCGLHCDKHPDAACRQYQTEMLQLLSNGKVVTDPQTITEITHCTKGGKYKCLALEVLCKHAERPEGISRFFKENKTLARQTGVWTGRKPPADMYNLWQAVFLSKDYTRVALLTADRQLCRMAVQIKNPGFDTYMLIQNKSRLIHYTLASLMLER